LRDANCIVIWHLCNRTSGKALSTVESLFQYLVYQALKLNPKMLNRKLRELDQDYLRKNHSVAEWSDLLHFVLDGLPKVFIIIEAESLVRWDQGNRSQMLFLLQSFQSLVSHERSNKQQLKVLLVS